MTQQDDIRQNGNPCEPGTLLQKQSPTVHCHFDNGQTFYKKDGTKLFSWSLAGDFTLPMIPCLVGTVLLLTAGMIAMLPIHRR